LAGRAQEQQRQPSQCRKRPSSCAPKKEDAVRGLPIAHKSGQVEAELDVGQSDITTPQGYVAMATEGYSIYIYQVPPEE